MTRVLRCLALLFVAACAPQATEPTAPDEALVATPQQALLAAVAGITPDSQPYADTVVSAADSVRKYGILKKIQQGEDTLWRAPEPPDTTPPPPPPPPPPPEYAGCVGTEPGNPDLVVTPSSWRNTSVASGARLVLEPGNYEAKTITGRRDFTICGPREAVIRGDLRITNAVGMTLKGFSSRRAFQAVYLKNVDSSRVIGLDISDVGQEAIHLVCGSVANLIEGNVIDSTGRSTARWGEGIYVGSDPSNRSQTCGSSSDASTDNALVANRIGPRVTGELIDVKPGADRTTLEANDLDGTGQARISGYSESLVVIRAGFATVLANTLRYPNDGGNANQSGFWIPGGNNGAIRALFDANVIDLWSRTGRGFRLESNGSTHTCKKSNIVNPESRRSNVSCSAN